MAGVRLSLGSLSPDGQFYDFAYGEMTARLKIRPYPATMQSFTVSRAGEMRQSGDEGFKRFDYCWTAAEGLEDAEGKPLPALTFAVKKEIYDWQDYNPVFQAIVLFVMSTSFRLDAARGRDEKD